MSVTSLDYIGYTCFDVESEHEKFKAAVEAFMATLIGEIETYETVNGDFVGCADAIRELVADTRDEILETSDTFLDNYKNVGTIAIRDAFEDAVIGYESRLSEYE